MPDPVLQVEVEARWAREPGLRARPLQHGVCSAGTGPWTVTLLSHCCDRAPETITSVHMLIGQMELGLVLRELSSYLSNPPTPTSPIIMLPEYSRPLGRVPQVGSGSVLLNSGPLGYGLFEQPHENRYIELSS